MIFCNFDSIFLFREFLKRLLVECLRESIIARKLGNSEASSSIHEDDWQEAAVNVGSIFFTLPESTPLNVSDSGMELARPVLMIRRQLPAISILIRKQRFLLPN